MAKKSIPSPKDIAKSQLNDAYRKAIKSKSTSTPLVERLNKDGYLTYVPVDYTSTEQSYVPLKHK